MNEENIKVSIKRRKWRWRVHTVTKNPDAAQSDGVGMVRQNKSPDQKKEVPRTWREVN